MFLRLGGHFLAPCRLFQLADPRGRQLRAKNELKMVTRSDYCPQADPTGEGGRVNTIPWDAEPPKMTGTFECYEVELQLFLKRFKCWSIVDGTEVRHTEDTAKQQEFDDLDNFARYCILSGVNQDDKELIYKESTAHAMWLRFVSLKTKQKTSFCHASRVREAVHSDVYTKDKDMIGWISGLEMQRRRLDSSPWAFSDTEFADLILKHAWLTHRAVHRQFAKSYVDQPPPSQQVASAEDNVDRMLEDAPLEIPLGVAAAATSGHKDPSVPQGHGDTKVCGGEGKGKRKRKQPPKPSEPCFKCKQLGHWKKECPKKKQKKTNAEEIAKMVLDLRAEPKTSPIDGGNQPDNDFEARQNVFQVSDEDQAIAARQFTVAGVVSTKLRRLEDDLAHSIDPPLSSYISNTNKELLCLEYVAGFQRQFEHMFPKRQPLYLFPPNEKGVRKFVCTTIRPTLLPYRDLYDALQLSRFVAGAIEYEPLVDPLQPPKCLPSPTFTLRCQRGDSFDMSILLASFLIGAGYDAYVVNGRAPRWICLLDQSKTPLPPLPMEEEVRKNREREEQQTRRLHRSTSLESDNDGGSSGVTGNKLESRSSFSSKYVLEQRQKEAKANEAKEKQYLDSYYDDEDDDDDPLGAQRVHAWILVRAGKRDVSDHYFIEPTTGRQYSLRNSPYYAIESVWNHENYWVNMQRHTIDTTLFDLQNPTDWEYVFLSAAEKKSAKDAVEDPKGSVDLGDDLKSLHPSEGDNQNDAEDDDLILDIPPSWVAKLALDRQAYRKRFVLDSQRITLYRRAKVEEFAENSHDQGLVLRVTLYRDSSCMLPIEIREYFKNRKDKLETRHRWPMEGKFAEYFGPGRQPEGLKKRTEWIGYRRELEFYTSARMDGLMKREEHIQKRTAETYEARDDYLIFRSVTLTSEKDEVDSKNPYVLPGGPTGELSIKKMKEKFARNPSTPADEDARKKTYNVQEGSIRVNFHYATGKITAGSRTYYKAPNKPVEVVMADPTATKPKLSVLEDELRVSIQMEKDCFAAVRHSEIETQDILKIRKREEMAITLETSCFDYNDEDGKAQKKDDTKDKGKDAKQEIDYLSPFLQSVHYNGGDLSKDDAHTVREMCLRNLKERLLERANIIQARLDRENSLLAKRQAAFQRSQREHDQGTDEEFERFCSETMFRIQILEQRLASHEETALQKYAEMDQRLHNDPRLRILHR